MSQHTDTETKFIKARIAMIMKQPFFGTMALRLKYKEDDTLNPPTAATNGKQIFVHPKWIEENDHDVIMSMVGHEVGHCFLDHIGRRRGREPQRWNQAGDYVINLLLKDSGLTVPSTWLCDARYANMSTDQVYHLLPPVPPGSGGGGAFDQIMDALAPGADPDLNQADWEQAAIQAATIAAAHGKMPDSLKRFMKEITTPKADWRAVMSRFATEVNKEDYSYRRLNKKFAAIGIFLPGLYSQSMGTMVDAIDTSGSISKEILAAFGSHLSEIKNQMKPKQMFNIYADARVNHVDEFDEYEDLTFEAYGGGGTDFRPVFEYIEEKNIEPRCFLYLTDGLGEFPKEAPDYPVLWLMTTDVIPPWGEVVRIEL